MARCTNCWKVASRRRVQGYTQGRGWTTIREFYHCNFCGNEETVTPRAPVRFQN